MVQTQRLKSLYIEKIIPTLKENFKYKNIHEIPRVKKIVINRGLNENCQNVKILELLYNEIKNISGQAPVTVKSKKSIANFKLKENMAVGLFVTLRGEVMYGFLDRLINLALPRIRDFQGLSIKSLDKKGNFNIGLNEQLMFPEIEFDKVNKVAGMDICIVTTAKNKEESLFLLKQLGMPFKL